MNAPPLIPKNQTLPSSPAPAPYIARDPTTGIETVTVTARRPQWWEDWRVWAGAALLVALLSRR